MTNNYLALNFVYDFSESQVLSNKTSITYFWKNAGVIPVKVTVMDTQGTLSRNSQQITVLNKPPKAFFTILCDEYFDNYKKNLYMIKYKL